MTIKQKIGAAIATGTFIAATLLPGAAFANTNITISGNGDGSANIATVDNLNATTIVQQNVSNVGGEIVAISKTGKNNANSNTNSNVTITTGNATTNVGVTIGGNANSANLPPCGCTGDTNITISGNGNESSNGAFVSNTKASFVSQFNGTSVVGGIIAKAKTGKNNANGNTGSNVTIHTGIALTGVSVVVGGSSNTLP